MGTGTFVTIPQLIERLNALASEHKCSSAPVRIGPVMRKEHAHETHDIDDIVVRKDSLGTLYVEISEIPF